MAQRVIEEIEEKKSTLLLIDLSKGKNKRENTLVNYLIDGLFENSDLYVLSHLETDKRAHKISSLSVHFLDKLVSPFDYAILFLDRASQKEKILDIVNRLSELKTRILILVPYRFFNNFIDLYIEIKTIDRLSVCFLGDVFGGTIKTDLSSNIHNVFITQKFTLSGNELTPIFPISESDLLKGVRYSLFGVKDSFTFYNFFYQHPQTLLSLAHLIKRVEPELNIIFKDKEKNIQQIEKTQEQIDKILQERTGIKPQNLQNVFSGFEKSINQMVDKESGIGNNQFINNSKTESKSIFKKFHIRIYKKILLYLFFAGLLCALVYISSFALSIYLFKKGVADFLDGKIISSSQNLEKSKSFFDVSYPFLSFTAELSQVVTPYPISKNLYFYRDSLYVMEDLLNNLRDYSKNMKIQNKELMKILANIIYGYFITQGTGVIPETFDQSKISDIISLSQTLPQILGYDSEKSYLVLFQNSNELRPTGGFIGSVANITIKNGKIKDTSVRDVYDLDGQLKVHVEPNFIVRRYLQPNLYLRDSNFSPDFTESASTSAMIYGLESGKTVDGVIALDTEVLKTVMDVVGPIKVPGISQEINSKNVTSLLQDKIEGNFFPGSTQKRQVLSAVLNNIIISIEKNQAKQTEILRKIPQLLFEKHILLSFDTKNLDKAYSSAGFAGGVVDNRINKNSIKDFLLVNEANIGVNKVNEFVTRRITYTAFLKDSKIDSDALIEYKNTGKSDYKVYFQIGAPFSSQLLKVIINGKEQEVVSAITDPKIYERQGFKPPSALEVFQEVKNEKKFMGFVTTVPKKSMLRIRMLYTTFLNPSSDISSYSMRFVKQPGTMPYPLTIQLQADSSFRLNSKDIKNLPILFDGLIRTDKEISVPVLKIK